MVVALEPTPVGWMLLEIVERDSSIEPFPVAVTTASPEFIAAYHAADVQWPLLTQPIEADGIRALVETPAHLAFTASDWR